MRAVIQRAKSASVIINNVKTAEISNGMVAFVAFSRDETDKSISYTLEKIIGLRIFEDENEKMNLSVKDVSGEVLFVPNFTLYGDVTHGKRPGFDKSAPPSVAAVLFDDFVKRVNASEIGEKVRFGTFQADMTILVENDGPVTILVDSDKNF